MTEQQQNELYEKYKALISSMNYEELLNQFCDIFDCYPYEYFSNALNATNTEKWIEALLDNYSFYLYQTQRS